MKKAKEVSDKEKQVQAIEEKRAELEEKLKVKVHAYWFDTEDGLIVGYLKEPDRYAKRTVLDLVKIGKFSHASETLIALCLIKEESNPLITSEDQKHDNIVLGFEQAVLDLVTYYTNTQKKS